MPGFQAGLDQALAGNDRLAASRGMLASGNNDADSIRLANDYGSQKYGQYVNGLTPFTSVPGQALGVASGQSGVATGLGSNLNASLGTNADLFNKAQIGKGNADASADLAGLTASGNIMNAIMGGAKLLMGAAGGGAGGGGGSSFFPSASFMQNGPNANL